MILGIDASNIRGGGGVTHLRELLGAADPISSGFEQVVVWAGSATLAQLEERPWLHKRTEPALEHGAARRAVWQTFRLGRLAVQAGCDVLFVPGGSFMTTFRPIVTMSQNLLPFEWHELRRYGVSLMTVKLLLLRATQSRSFRKAAATIFLTDHAKSRVLQVCGPLAGLSPVIPHGIDRRFLKAPRVPRGIGDCDQEHPFRAVYVSAVEPYKHQWFVAEAVAFLRDAGLPISLDLIGPANPRVLPRLQKTLARADPAAHAIKYLGAVPYEAIHAAYQTADVAIFASSCETIANILIEGMAAGLPTASSNAGAMQEILGDAGVYFNPEMPRDIEIALRRLIEDPPLRARNAQLAFRRAQAFSWQRCADDTFALLAQVGRSEHKAAL